MQIQWRSTMNPQCEFRTKSIAAREMPESSAGRVTTTGSDQANTVQVGRHPTPGLLQRRFPGVFRSWHELPGLRPGHGVPSVIGGLSAWMLRCRALMRLWRERSRTRYVLVRLSVTELHDLGLSRSQIIAEVNKPFWKE
jgi:uncharacterized protein YjiS (DUF1127 family)